MIGELSIITSCSPYQMEPGTVFVLENAANWGEIRPYWAGAFLPSAPAGVDYA